LYLRDPLLGFASKALILQPLINKQVDSLSNRIGYGAPVNSGNYFETRELIVIQVNTCSLHGAFNLLTVSHEQGGVGGREPWSVR
jgi:hypothetical protein